MNNFKKLTAMVSLTAILLTGCTQQTEISSGECGVEGSNITWTIDNGSTLLISGEGAMVDWDSKDSPWFNNDSIQRIVLEDGITNIGNQAFCNCRALTAIEIPDSVTIIGAEAFLNCEALTQFTVPAQVTSIGTAALSACSSLAEIIVEDENAHYSAEKGVLFDKEMTTLVQYPKGRKGNLYIVPDGVTSIGEKAFSHNTSLAKIQFPNTLTRIEQFAFQSCDALTDITIPKSVTTIGKDAFAACNQIESFTIENPECEIFDSEHTLHAFTENRPVIHGYAYSTAYNYAQKYNKRFSPIYAPVGENSNANFNQCGEHLTWSLDNEGTLTFSGEGDMTDWSPETSPWYENDQIKNVIIPYSVTSIGNHAFDHCSAIASITIENPNCTMYDYAEAIPESAVIYASTPSTAAEYAEKYGREFIALDETPEETQIIDSGECGARGDNLTWTLDNEGTLTVSGTGELATWLGPNSPWYHNNQIKTIVIEPGMTKFKAFAFVGCTAATSITIPDSLTDIGSFPFADCFSLTEINVDEANAHYMSIDGVLFDKKGQWLMKYPAGKTDESYTIPDSVTGIAITAFEHNDYLKELTIPKSVQKIEHGLFRASDALTAITIENPDCIIGDFESTILDGTTIYGYKGSTAQDYAEKRGRNFVAID